MPNKRPSIYDHPSVSVGKKITSVYKKFRKVDNSGKTKLTEEEISNPRPSTLQKPSESASAFSVTPLPPTTAKKQRASNLEKAKLRRFRMEELSQAIRNSIRAHESVSGRCCADSGCPNPAKFRCINAPKKFCKEHAIYEARNRTDIIDIKGRPIFGRKKRKGHVLFVYPTHWQYKAKPDHFGEFVPGSPKRFTVLFHSAFMNNCFNMAREGLALNKIWRIALKHFTAKLPMKCYKQFINAFIEFNGWKTLESNLIFSEKPKPNEVQFGFRCPCCFGDAATSKTIILVKKEIVL